MITLTVSAFMALATTCAPQVSGTFLLPIATVESGLSPLAIHDNTEKRSYHPGDTAEAIALAHQLLSAGHSIDAGLMQINDGNFGWTGLTVEAAFDPCSSIAAGAAVLTAVSRYNTGNSQAGFTNGYVDRVVATSLEQKGDSVSERSQAQPHLLKARLSKPKPAALPAVQADAPHDWNVFAADSEGGGGQSFLITGQSK